MTLRTSVISLLIVLSFAMVYFTYSNQPDVKEGVGVESTLFITPTDKEPLQLALEYYGQTEKLTNGKPNPIVSSFYDEFVPHKITDNQTAWCSAFMNSIFASCGYEYSGSLAARSWTKVGVKIEKPIPGDVVIFWREKKTSWKGHVAMYISQDSKYIYCLGGNQSNMVNIQKYSKDRLLEYRRPRKLNKGANFKYEPYYLDLDSTNQIIYPIDSLLNLQ